MITLIPVHQDESEELSAMARQIWPSVYSQIISHRQIEYMLDWMYSTSKLRSEIESGEIFYRWIGFEGTRIGFLGYEQVALSATELHKLYLLPSSHGRGLGQASLTALAAELSKLGTASISLRVNRHNRRAIACYERFGFTKIDEHCLDIGEGFVMDDYLYRFDLPESAMN
ncbi:MAG: GNAT family N-acetyltransferase [Verrucomicrobiota bacterium]